MDRIGPDPGEEVPKAERLRLTYAELWMLLGVKCEQWRRWIEDDDDGLPFEQWPTDDPFRALAHTYGLNKDDLGKLLNRMGDSCEARALRAGYDEHWDPLPAHEASPRAPRHRRAATA